MTHTISKGCGCDLCLQPVTIPEFPGMDVTEAKWAAYAESRVQHGINQGRPPGRRPVRGAHDTDPIYDISEKPDGQANPDKAS